MTTSSLNASRTRRIATWAGALAVMALPVVLLALIMGAGVPESWWPQTGQAFAAAPPHSGSTKDPCEKIEGPARKYCERGQRSSASSSAADEAPGEGSGAAWMVIPAAAGLAAVVVWRRRSAAGPGRR
ncbi:hypothetical protein ACF1AO_34040 [Streptomyces longwoodensis]|uniref:hypothetical protein n=1 Tax=Streptomyces longwoodensis TaxID=68231 RepID=UPI0036F6D6C8